MFILYNTVECIITKNMLILRTPFMIQKFDSIEDFIVTIFPDIESYLRKALSANIHMSDLDTIAYSELERKFKEFIIQNYSDNLDEYLSNETKHVSKEAMKDILLSTISITLNVSDVTGQKLTDSEYLNSLRNIIDKFA